MPKNTHKSNCKTHFPESQNLFQFQFNCSSKFLSLAISSSRVLYLSLLDLERESERNQMRVREREREGRGGGGRMDRFEGTKLTSPHKKEGSFLHSLSFTFLHPSFSLRVVKRERERGSRIFVHFQTRVNCWRSIGQIGRAHV